jgi:hypothetical protein
MRVGVIVDITPDGIWFLRHVRERPVFIPRLEPTILRVYPLEVKAMSDMFGSVVVRNISMTPDVGVVPLDSRVLDQDGNFDFPDAVVYIYAMRVARRTTVRVVDLPPEPYPPSATERLWGAIVRRTFRYL